MKQGASICSGVGHVPLVAIGAVTVAILLFSAVARVEGGCSRFGHSCFGAHGKRADIGPVEGRLPENLPSGGDMMYPAAANYGGYPNLNVNGVRVSPYFLDWLVATRRDQELKSADRGSVNEGSQGGGVVGGGGASLDMRK